MFQWIIIFVIIIPNIWFLQGTLNGKPVAVKSVLQFEIWNEIKILKKLPQFKYIVNALGFYEMKSDNRVYIIMELCDRSLKCELDQNDGLNWSQFKELLLCFSQAFKFLRSNNIVHSDIKPDNILLSNGKFKLGDFGLSLIAPRNSRLKMAGGTFSYCHPAVFKSQYWVQLGYPSEPADDLPHDIDLYSTGVTLFQSITCKLPFRATGHKQMYRLLMHKKGRIRGTEVNGQNFYFDCLPPCSIKFDYATGEAVRSLIKSLLMHEEEKMMTFEAFYAQCGAIVNMK